MATAQVHYAMQPAQYQQTGQYSQPIQYQHPQYQGYGTNAAAPDSMIEQKVRDLFHRCANASGILNKRELITICRTDKEVAEFLGLPMHIKEGDGSREAFENFFQGLDLNSVREITWPQFWAWFRQKMRPREPLGEYSQSPHVAAPPYPQSQQFQQYQSVTHQQPQQPMQQPQTLRSLTAGGQLFMDDGRNWSSIADIAKALVIIEADEKFLVQEIQSLPGGEQALEWFKAGGGPGGNPGILAKIKQGAEDAKRKAHDIAQHAKKEAVDAKKKAKDADDKADEAEAFNETQMLPHMQMKIQKAQENEARKTDAARRANEEWNQANEAAGKAKADYDQAQDNASKHAAYLQWLLEQLKHAKQEASRHGITTDIASHLDDQDVQAHKLQHEAAKAADAAKRALAKAQDRAAKFEKVKQVFSPQAGGRAAQVLHQVQTKVEKAKASQKQATHARQKVESLETLIAQLSAGLEEAKKERVKADEAAAADEQEVNVLRRDSEHLRQELGLTDLDETPEEAINEAHQHATDADVAAKKAQAEADRLARERDQVVMQVQQTKANLQNLPNFDDLEDKIDKAKFDNEQAKASADAAAQLARAAAERAKLLHDKALRLGDDLEKSRAARQGEESSLQQVMHHFMPPGYRTEVDPKTGRTYYIDPQGRTSWELPQDPAAQVSEAHQFAQIDRQKAKEADANARQALDNALQMQADAEKMDQLARLLEKTVADRAALEAIVRKAGEQAQIYKKEVEDMTDRAHEIMERPLPQAGHATVTTTATITTTTAPGKVAMPNVRVEPEYAEGESVYKFLTNLMGGGSYATGDGGALGAGGGGSSTERFTNEGPTTVTTTSKQYYVGNEVPAYYVGNEIPACGIRRDMML